VGSISQESRGPDRNLEHDKIQKGWAQRPCTLRPLDQPGKVEKSG
jgi:hypothetical protein